VDVGYAGARGIPLVTSLQLTHGGEDVAEHVMFLALAGDIEAVVSLGARHRLAGTYVLPEKYSLVGLGRTEAPWWSGRGFGMRVWAVAHGDRRMQRRWRRWKTHDICQLPQSDFVSHVPNKETRG
jgi:hypothetical protein